MKKPIQEPAKLPTAEPFTISKKETLKANFEPKELEFLFKDVKKQNETGVYLIGNSIAVKFYLNSYFFGYIENYSFVETGYRLPMPLTFDNFVTDAKRCNIEIYFKND